MRISGSVILKALICLLALSCGQNPRNANLSQSKPYSTSPRIAKTYNSGFALAHDTYNGISSASDGKIYYVLCSQSIDTGGQIYSLDPKTDAVQHLGDLTEICGEKGLKAIVQGKSHVKFVESAGKLYFATHIGYYSIIDGILTMNMDTRRGVIYGLTWPTGYFFRYDLAKKEFRDLGPAMGEGESGKGAAFRVICRSLAINPEDGSVFMTNPEGTILSSRFGQDKIEVVEGEDMRKDYFGHYDPSSSGSMGCNWRQVVWCQQEKKFYGVHGNSGYLFSFDPAIPKIEVLDRLMSKVSQRIGMFDQFSYGYPGFTLGPDGHTLYYLTGGPIYKDGKRITGKSSTSMGEAKGLENLHLITYDIA